MLVAEGQEHGCPRCGRAFTVAVVPVNSASAYRDMPLLELVPVTDSPPFGRAIELATTGMYSLKVRVGDAEMIHLGLTIAIVAAGTLVTGLSLMTILWVWHLSRLAFLAVSMPIMAVLMWLTAPLRRQKSERLTVIGSLLEIRRYEGFDCLRTEEVDLRRVVGVHDATGRVRVMLDDGRSMMIGDGLKVPSDVTRWLARRIDHLVPIADRSALSPSGTGDQDETLGPTPGPSRPRGTG